jgi:hypothetical protein
MNRAQAIEKYEGNITSPLRICPACFALDHHDRLDACSHRYAFNAVMAGGSACQDCGHSSENPFPIYGSTEAKKEMLEFLEYVIKADSAHDRDKRYAINVLALIHDSFEWVKQ